jgi:hypothetical protein
MHHGCHKQLVAVECETTASAYSTADIEQRNRVSPVSLRCILPLAGNTWLENSLFAQRLQQTIPKALVLLCYFWCRLVGFASRVGLLGGCLQDFLNECLPV